MEIFVISIVAFFIIRAFVVAGRNTINRNRELRQDRTREIQRLLESMRAHDVYTAQGDEFAAVSDNHRALKHYTVGPGENYSRKQKSEIAYSILKWGIEHGLAQFTHFAGTFDLKDSSSILDKHIEYVFDIETLDARVDWSAQAETVTYVPDEVFVLPKLECLYFGDVLSDYLYDVELEGIPESIGRAKNLKYLHLQYCGLKELPPQIFTPWLEELKIGGNDIRVIPDAIENATDLPLRFSSRLS